MMAQVRYAGLLLKGATGAIAPVDFEKNLKWQLFDFGMHYILAPVDWNSQGQSWLYTPVDTHSIKSTPKSKPCHLVCSISLLRTFARIALLRTLSLSLKVIKKEALYSHCLAWKGNLHVQFLTGSNVFAWTFKKFLWMTILQIRITRKQIKLVRFWTFHSNF